MRRLLLAVLLVACDDEEPTCADWLICYEQCKADYPGYWPPEFEEWGEISYCGTQCPGYVQRYELIMSWELAALSCDPDSLRGAARERAACVSDS